MMYVIEFVLSVELIIGGKIMTCKACDHIKFLFKEENFKMGLIYLKHKQTMLVLFW